MFAWLMFYASNQEYFIFTRTVSVVVGGNWAVPEETRDLPEIAEEASSFTVEEEASI